MANSTKIEKSRVKFVIGVLSQKINYKDLENVPHNHDY